MLMNIDPLLDLDPMQCAKADTAAF